MDRKHSQHDHNPLTRRKFIGAAATVSALAITAPPLEAQSPDHLVSRPQDAANARLCSLSINGVRHELSVDPRVTLLDMLREHLHLTGTKKGCDHGQCGACTVLVNGERILSCLSLAVSQDGHKVTTIEGLSHGQSLHPMQAAFLEHDGFQCGFCTPGQICSAVAVLEEIRQGAPSAVTLDVSHSTPIDLTEDEVRERLSGNICRCGAYPNIVASVLSVYSRERS